jgi:transposase
MLAKNVVLWGEKLVLDRISSSIALTDVLVQAFSKELAQKILSLAYYLVCTGEPLSCAEAWQIERGLSAMNASRISEVLSLLAQETCSSFFSAWVENNAKSKTLCYDITSVSTFANGMDQSEFGSNRDREKWLKPINLAILADKKTHVPLAFKVVNGSISDVKTLKAAMADLKMYPAVPYALIMDRGSWSNEKLKILMDEGIKFMVLIPSTLSWAKQIILKHCNDVFVNPPQVDSDGNATYGFTVYDPAQSGHRVWAHLFYCSAIERERKEKFAAKYALCKKELQDGLADETHQAFYNEHFTLGTRDRDGKLHVEEKRHLSEILAERKFGYWVLCTDMEKDAMTALSDYREKNFIESGFDDIKGSADGKRLRVHDDKALYARLFLQFCAQTLRTALRNSISGFPAEARKHASSPAVLLAIVRSFAKVSYKGKFKSQFTAPTEAQELIFKALDIAVAEPTDEEENTKELLA